MNPTFEDDLLARELLRRNPYAEPDHDYTDYEPAYRTGYEGYSTHYSDRGLTYDQAEPTLRQQYETQHGNSRLGWEKAKHATRDAWDRVERALPGDADHDGK